jgi:hypothetical protein
MTLLTIAQNVLKKNKASTVPTTIISNDNDTARQVFEAIRDATKIVFTATDWQVMTKRYSFNTVASQEAYNLPSDIEDTKIVTDTIWNAGTRLQLIGPLSFTTWQNLQNWTVVSPLVQNFIVYGSQFRIYPTPTSSQSINYFYIANTPIRAEDGSEQADWLADDDYSVLSEYAIELQASWLYLKQLGRPYEETKNTADDYLSDLINQDGVRGTISVNMQQLPPRMPEASWLGILIR